MTDSAPSLYHAVLHHAREAGERPAAAFGDETWSYGELVQDVERCADALTGLGVRAGDRVAMASTPRPEFLTVLLACQRLGAVWIGLNPKYREGELAFILEDSAPRIIFAIARHPDGDPVADLAAMARKRADLRAPLITIGEETSSEHEAWGAFLARGKEPVCLAELSDPPVSARDAAVLVYTSGSTGKPKGAILPHEAFAHCQTALSLADSADINFLHEPRIICNLPTNHVGCLTDTLGMTLLGGGLVVFMERFDPAAMPALMERYQVTILGGVPLMLQMLLTQADLQSADLSSLKAIGWGGAAMPGPVLDALARFETVLFTTYGLTEGGSISTVTPYGADRDTLLNSVGRPAPDQDVRIVGADGTVLPQGEAGEIQIRGRGVMVGYWNNAEATRAVWTEDGWLKTGDVGAVRPDGAIELRGRLVEMFKSGGYNVYPREVELALEAHQGVAMAAVLGVAHPTYGEAGVAYVLPAAEVDEDTLRAHCKAELAGYKVPQRIIVDPDPPLLPIGKIDKKALKPAAEQLLLEKETAS